MENQTFDLRNGKTLNRKSISFDGTLLSESFLKPLFGLYDKHRGFLGGLMETAEYTKTLIDPTTISDNVKLKLTNKRALYILVEETIVNYKKDSALTTNTSVRYYFHHIYNDKDINMFNEGSIRRHKERGTPIETYDNLIRNNTTTLDDNVFTTYYIIDGFYKAGASNHMREGETLNDHIDTHTSYDRNIVVEHVIYSEV